MFSLIRLPRIHDQEQELALKKVPETLGASDYAAKKTDAGEFQARPEVCRNRRAWRPVLRKGATSKHSDCVDLTDRERNVGPLGLFNVVRAQIPGPMALAI